MYRYRVFVSYSHDDAEKAQIVRAHLKEIGAEPMLDVDLPPGESYAKEIRQRIACAHVFMPLLTSASKERPWVHQEIGYAMGMGVPILPLALDELPKGMAEHIQAMRVRADLDDLAARLTRQRVEDVVHGSQEAGLATFQSAPEIRERTRVLVEGATYAYRHHGPGRIRQSGAFSSFSLPDYSPGHARWDRRNPTADAALRKLLRQERQIMEKHARQAGCDLELDPYVRVRHAGPDHQFLRHDRAGTATRVRTLLEFFESMPDDKLRVLVRPGEIEGSLILVGDLFFAEAVVPHYAGGYRQTDFTWHAPTVLKRVREFDDEFEEHLAEAGLEGRSSRLAAIEKLRELLGECERKG
jgi:hypothetical protein